MPYVLYTMVPWNSEPTQPTALPTHLLDEPGPLLQHLLLAGDHRRQQEGHSHEQTVVSRQLVRPASRATYIEPQGFQRCV